MRPQSNQERSYEFFRVSYPVVFLCCLVGGAFLIFTVFQPQRFLGWIGVLSALTIALNFYAIRISVDRETLLVLYGIGLIAREFDRHEITGFSMVENHSFHAIYSAGADQVPQLSLRDGRTIVLPVTDTQRLAQVLRVRNRTSHR